MANEQTGVDDYAGLRSRCVDAVRRRLGGALSLAVDPEDIVQDSFVRALTRDLQDPAVTVLPLEGRLRVISRHRIWEEARRLGREDALHARCMAAEAMSELDERESLKRAREELVRLRRDHRWTLVLRDLLDAPWETVAFVMNQPSANAAECLHRRAKAKLRSRLADLTRE